MRGRARAAAGARSASSRRGGRVADAQFLKAWAGSNPRLAYVAGLDAYGGKLLVPTDSAVANATKRLRAVEAKSATPSQRAVLRSARLHLEWEEPFLPVLEAMWALYAHHLRGAPGPRFAALAGDTASLLRVSRERMRKKAWSIEVRIHTTLAVRGLHTLALSLRRTAKNRATQAALGDIAAAATDYGTTFALPGIETGSLQEAEPLLRDRDPLQRKALYPRMLRDFYAFPASADELERFGHLFLTQELGFLKDATRALADAYKCEPTPERVKAEMGRRVTTTGKEGFARARLLRAAMAKFYRHNVVRVTPTYHTEMVPTPAYFEPLFPTAGVTSHGNLRTPRNLFFYTTNSEYAPPWGLAEVVQTIAHEEYGHGVCFSNSLTEFVDEKVELADKLPTSLELPVSDAVAFNREREFTQLFEELISSRNGHKGAKEFLAALDKHVKDRDLFLLENRFETALWRVVRGLRVVGDVRINMGKSGALDFVDWGAKETGLSRKMVWDQVFTFQDTPGYAPAYAYMGERLRALENEALEDGLSRVDFNTQACSVGWAPWPQYENRLRNWVGLMTD